MIAPVVDSACRIPTDAEDDWMIAVTPAPTSTPSTGLEIAAKQIRELRQISQRCNCALHDRHADEQNTETGEDIRDIAGTALLQSS